MSVNLHHEGSTENAGFLTLRPRGVGFHPGEMTIEARLDTSKAEVLQKWKKRKADCQELNGRFSELCRRQFPGDPMQTCKQRRICKANFVLHSMQGKDMGPQMLSYLIADRGSLFSPDFQVFCTDQPWYQENVLYPQTPADWRSFAIQEIEDPLEMALSDLWLRHFERYGTFLSRKKFQSRAISQIQKRPPENQSPHYFAVFAKNAFRQYCHVKSFGSYLTFHRKYYDWEVAGAAEDLVRQKTFARFFAEWELWNHTDLSSKAYAFTPVFWVGSKDILNIDQEKIFKLVQVAKRSYNKPGSEFDDIFAQIARTCFIASKRLSNETDNHAAFLFNFALLSGVTVRENKRHSVSALEGDIRNNHLHGDVFAKERYFLSDTPANQELRLKMLDTIVASAKELDYGDDTADIALGIFLARMPVTDGATREELDFWDCRIDNAALQTRWCYAPVTYRNVLKKEVPACLPVQHERQFCYRSVSRRSMLHLGVYQKIVLKFPEVIRRCASILSDPQYSEQRNRYLSHWSALVVDREQIKEEIGAVCSLVPWKKFHYSLERYYRESRYGSDVEELNQQISKLDSQSRQELQCLLVESALRICINKEAEKAICNELSKIMPVTSPYVSG